MLLVVFEFTLKVYTVWRVMLCLLLTLLSDPLYGLWATEYFNAFLIIDYKQRKKRGDVVFVADISKQRINPSTSKSFYFLKSSLCEFWCLRFVHISSVFTACISMFDTMRMKWPVMRLMFLMSELQINFCLFYPVYFFLIGFDLNKRYFFYRIYLCEIGCRWRHLTSLYGKP